MEESDGTRALVMELVEGPTLAERLEQGPLPFNESLSVCVQIAHALEEAHEKGIVHRDLKPQNIKASIEGKVKVLDFGLAKAMDPTGAASGGGSASQLAASPTLTLGATVQGMILGTAAYMSPEQAKGFAVDKRADIWAFGVVLFEMLTGRRLFEGDSVPDTLARVLQREIDFDALPDSTPPAIRRLLRRCLERQPKKRLRDIGDARLVIDDVAAGRDGETLSGSAPVAPQPRFAWLPWSAALLLAAGLAVTLATNLGRGSSGESSPSLPLVRTSILLPDRGDVALQTRGSFALSPDGGAVVFTVFDETGGTLFVRELAETEPRELTGTQGATRPFWSPDSQQIAFFAQGGLRRVPRAGGAVQTICPAQDTRGGTWGREGTIVFAQGLPGALYRVPATGGSATAATRLDTEAKESSHLSPTFLPDGRHFLFGAYPADDSGRMPVKIASLDEVSSGRLLLAANSAPRYAPPGELVFLRDAALVAQSIDLDRLEMVGETRQLAESPENQGYYGVPAAELSNDGKMLYPPPDDRPSELVVFDRSGHRLDGGRRLGGDYFNFRLSHRGDRFAAIGRDVDRKWTVWVFDLAGGDGVRISPPGADANGDLLWSPDDREILATLALGSKASRLVPMRLAIQSGEVHPLLESEVPSGYLYAGAWSADGKIVVFMEVVEGQKQNIGYLDLDRGAELTTYLATPADESAIELSPDGRWLAYISDVSGRPQANVDSFPHPSGARRIATGGPAVAIAFRADGRELLVSAIEGDLATAYSCELRLGDTIEIGRPRRLYSVSRDSRGGDAAPGFDRFYLLNPVGQRVPTLTLVENWHRQLETTR
jgi:Tol biopolymer transport system component